MSDKVAMLAELEVTRSRLAASEARVRALEKALKAIAAQARPLRDPKKPHIQWAHSPEDYKIAELGDIARAALENRE